MIFSKYFKTRNRPKKYPVTVGTNLGRFMLMTAMTNLVTEIKIGSDESCHQNDISNCVFLLVFNLMLSGSFGLYSGQPRFDWLRAPSREHQFGRLK